VEEETLKGGESKWERIGTMKGKAVKMKGLTQLEVGWEGMQTRGL